MLKKYRKLILVALLPIFMIITSGLVYAENAADCTHQTDLLGLIRRVLKKEESKKEAEKKKISLQVVPLITASPSTGFSFGAAMSAVGYRESEEENVSSVMSSIAFSTKGQILFVTRSDVTQQQFLRLVGDWRYYDYTERTYGLGSDTTKNQYSDVDYKWARFREAALLAVAHHMDIGAEYDLDYHFQVQPFQVHGFTYNNVKTTSSGISPVLIFDSTDNRLNASRGVYSRVLYRFYPKALGSDSSWQEFDGEARFYFSLSRCRRQVLAFWELAQIVTNGTPPYFDLPSNGWDMYNRSARGYAQGRYRGYGWLYSEVEYRADLTRNGLVGAVVFANVSSLSKDDQHKFEDTIPGGGFGFRFKIDKKTGSNFAVDFGFGKENSKSVYVAFNEVF